MKRLYKGIILLLVISVFGILSGCSSTKSDMKGIKNLVQQDIFKQKEEKYWVFFYREGCSGCEEVKPYVLKYIDYRKGRDECKKIYGVNLSNEKNSSIYRTYKNEDGNGQGQYTDGDGVVHKGIFYVNHVTNWDDLYIGTTPSLISITKSKDGNYAYFVTSGSVKIKNLLNDELNK